MPYGLLGWSKQGLRRSLYSTLILLDAVAHASSLNAPVTQATMLTSAVLRKLCGRLGVLTHGSPDSAELPQYCGSVIISVFLVAVLRQYCPKKDNKYNFFEYCGSLNKKNLTKTSAVLLSSVLVSCVFFLKTQDLAVGTGAVLPQILIVAWNMNSTYTMRVRADKINVTYYFILLVTLGMILTWK